MLKNGVNLNLWHMFKIRNKKNNFQLRSIIWRLDVWGHKSDQV